ncbi:MAG: hypothetical protein DRI37_04555 [Chloroflexi bacterium]|nr:MAG: hypothetical protein DRI37_04555 [Chloroflexota bacterium]
MVWALPALLLLGLILYWQLIIAEGAYLGRHAVTWLYDRSARIYDNIKQYNPDYEQWFLGAPLTRALALVPDPLVLDVATGTGRLARTLLPQAGFHGRMIALDYSREMLREAVKTTRPWSERLTFLWQDAAVLPFPDDTFDAVSCLEASEFMSHPDQVLAELVRVLRPGGILLTTNRIGQQARLLPGHTYAPATFEALLHSLNLEMVRTQPWQEDYDLLWAVKPGAGRPVGMRRLPEILRCPRCGSPLRREDDAFVCAGGRRYPIAEDGVIELAR